MPHITADTIIGLIALVSGYTIYFFDLRKKLNEILADREGILTKSQADHLLDLYLDAIHHHLVTALRQYFDRDYLADRDRGNIEVIMKTVAAAYDAVVKNNKRQMVSTFELRGRKSFESILNSADVKLLRSTVFQMRTVFVNAIDCQQNPIETRLLLEGVLLQGKNSGHEVLSPMIASTYRVKKR